MQDDEGLDFPNIHEVKCQAAVYAGQLLCDAKEHFWDSADFELTMALAGCRSIDEIGPEALVPAEAPAPGLRTTEAI